MMVSESHVFAILSQPTMNVEHGCIAHIENIVEYLFFIVLIVWRPNAVNVFDFRRQLATSH